MNSSSLVARAVPRYNAVDAAFLVGVDLFGLSGVELARARRAGEQTLALLPAKVRKPAVKGSDDDFAF